LRSQLKNSPIQIQNGLNFGTPIAAQRQEQLNAIDSAFQRLSLDFSQEEETGKTSKLK